MNRKRFLYLSLVLTILLASLVMPLFQPSVVVADQPSQPTNLEPSDNATGQPLTPKLSASGFSDNGEDTHAASWWQIRLDADDYSTPVYDSGPSTASTSIVIPTGELSYLATYYWHVSYQDNYGLWSDNSAETSFTTTGPQPNRPSNVSPSDNATGVILTPTLQSSAFSDNNTSDTHVASQWQIRSSSGDYNTPPLVFESGRDTSNLTSVVIPVATLSYTTTYYWHVRHQDNNLDWSEWSLETSFTTMANQPPDQPSNVSPPPDATVSRTPTLESSVFSDDPGDTHTASRWQISTSPVTWEGNLVFDNVTSAYLTSTVIPADTLLPSTTYYWHVSYQDNNGAWSDNSTAWYFTTSANQSPNPPTNSLPVNGAGGQSLTPTLVGSGFVDPDPGDKHTATRWQIRTSSGDYTTGLVFDNVTAIDLTSIVVPSGTLTYFTTYYWHVKYEDKHGGGRRTQQSGRSPPWRTRLRASLATLCR